MLSAAVYFSSFDSRDPDVVLRIQALYDRVGMPSLFLQFFTGFVLAYLHFPDLAAWLEFEVPMGRLIVVKLGLMILVGVCALDLRLRVLSRVGSLGLRSIRWHAYLVTGLSAVSVFVGASFRIGWLY